MAKICPICEQSAVIKPSGGIVYIDCSRCGAYRITEEALEDFIPAKHRLSARVLANVSSWLRENPNYLIRTDNIGNLLKVKTPGFHERADKILIALERETGYIGYELEVNSTWMSLGWCLNNEELDEILRFLTGAKRLQVSGPGRYKIVADGWQHLENIKKVNADSQQGFVAMWFDETMKDVYDHAISEGIIDAGYRPHRVDLREHNDKIDDEIIAQIRRSRFVLADFTEHRGGVYFESGFAKGLGLEVFWTCRRDHLDKLHFDIRQYSCIDWEPDKLEDFRARIKNRIESVLGRGTYRRED
jgi:hypothetical protein